MARFDEGSVSLIQKYKDVSLARLKALGLSFALHDDMHAWAGWLRDQPESHGVADTHNPSRTHLDPGNSFWALITDSAGRKVACHAMRLIVTDDLYDDIVTETVFSDLLPPLRQHRLDLSRQAADLGISGRVGLGGGAYIHPDWRGRGIYEILAPLTRAYALPHFKLDWYVAFFLATDSRTRLALDGAGFARAVPLLSGVYPPYGREVEIQIATATRRQILEWIKRDLKDAPAASRTALHKTAS